MSFTDNMVNSSTLDIDISSALNACGQSVLTTDNGESDIVRELGRVVIHHDNSLCTELDGNVSK